MRAVAPDELAPLSSVELATFVAAMDAGSVHGAADALNLTASAATKRLQSLERQLGVALFERGRFGLRSTDAGRLLYPEARQALLALARARDTVAATRERRDRRVSLAASHTVGEFLLPAWLAGFQRGHPGTRAQVDVVNSPGVLAAVRDGDADVGFVEGVDALDGLETLTVFEDELVVVVAASHRWARRRDVRAGELTKEPFVSREQRSGTRAVADAALATAGVTLAPAVEVASIQGVKRALPTRGFAIMSPLAIEAEVSAGTLRGLPVRDVALTRRLHAVRRPGGRPSAAAAAFWAWIEGETG